MHTNTPPHIQELSDSAEEDVLNVDDDDELVEVPDTFDSSSFDEKFDSPDESDSEKSHSPIQDDASITFRLHSSPVFSCAVHPHQKWVATGCEDDIVYIWHLVTGEKIQAIRRHEDTVISLELSYNGDYLASGDMSGIIQVYETKNNFEPIWNYTMGDMRWLLWHSRTNVLLAGSAEGEVYVWKIPSGISKIIPGFGESCEIAEVSGDGKKLFAGYGDGSVRLWDIKTCSIVMSIDSNHPMAHKENVTTVSCDKNSPMYASGSEDNTILFSTNNGPIGHVQTNGSVECLAFSPSNKFKVVASGSLHGELCIWDPVKSTMRTQCDVPERNNAITTLKWISDFVVLVGTNHGNIHAFDARDGSRKFTFLGHKSDIYNLVYSPHNSVVISVSEDKTAKVFECPAIVD